jgi:hypothetical protein
MPIHHHLRGNPFQENRHDHEMIGRRTEMQRIFSVCDEALENCSPTIIPLLGPYGIGKTFTLLQLRDKLRDRGCFSKSRKVLTAYLTATQEKFPGKYSLYVYTCIMDDIGKHGMLYLRNELENMNKPEDEVLQKLKEDDFKKAFRLLNSSEEEISRAAWGWLRGENISLKKQGVYSKITNDEMARKYFLDFCRLLKSLDYDGFVVLLDELEQAYSQGVKNLSKVVIWARELYDKVARILSSDPDEMVPVILIIGSAPETWKAITELSERGRGKVGEIEAFLSRIPKENYINLEPLSLDEVKELIRQFLAKVHEPGFKPPDPLYPFDDESINLIFEVSQGVPRFVIRCARILLRNADGENKKITKENADRWFRKARITE